jgi:hypothetical protein
VYRRSLVGAAVAALLLTCLAGPVTAAASAPEGFMPAGTDVHGVSPVKLATANLTWSAGPPFGWSGWAQERCGPSPTDPTVWFLGGPPVYPQLGTVPCTLPEGTSLVIEGADLIASEAFGDGDTADKLLAALDATWPDLITVKVTLDGQTAANPTGYVVTSSAITLPADNLFGSDPALTQARYYQLVTLPLSPGRHTLKLHYEWASNTITPAWSDRDYSILVLSASAVTATTTRAHVFGTASLVEPPVMGTMRTHGNVQSMRGFTEHLRSDPAPTNNAYVTGDEVNVVNWDANLKANRGKLWGTGVHHPFAYPDGTWECSFTGTFSDYANGVWAGKGVCHGTGTLAGWQWRADISSTPWGATAMQGFIFFPGE